MSAGGGQAPSKDHRLGRVLRSEQLDVVQKKTPTRRGAPGYRREAPAGNWRCE